MGRVLVDLLGFLPGIKLAWSRYAQSAGASGIALALYEGNVLVLGAWLWYPLGISLRLHNFIRKCDIAMKSRCSVVGIMSLLILTIRRAVSVGKLAIATIALVVTEINLIVNRVSQCLAIGSALNNNAATPDSMLYVPIVLSRVRAAERSGSRASEATGLLDEVLKALFEPVKPYKHHECVYEDWVRYTGN